MIRALLTMLLALCTAAAAHAQSKENRWKLKFSGLIHFGYSSLESSGLQDNKVGDGKDGYHYTALNLDPSYAAGDWEYGVHLKLEPEPYFDNDGLDEAAFTVKSKRFGMLYLGEDDGAGDRLKPPRAGRTNISLGHGAFTGVVNWWGNLPQRGGVDPPKSRFGTVIRDNPRRPFGIPGGDWRIAPLDTSDAIKLGYQSPKKKRGVRVGVSVNLQETNKGRTDVLGSGHEAAVEQDSWSGLRFQGDEYELGIEWNRQLDRDNVLGLGATYISTVLTRNAKITAANLGARITHFLPGGGDLAASLNWGTQRFEPTAFGRTEKSKRGDETLWHLGGEWKKEKWKIGANYVLADDSRDPRSLMETGGGGNRGWSLGADYALSKEIRAGVGYLKAKNDEGEEVSEIGLNMIVFLRGEI